MKLFIKPKHYFKRDTIIGFGTIFFVLSYFCVRLWLIKTIKLHELLIGISSCGVLVAFIARSYYRYYGKFGLYIDGEKIYYRSYRIRNITSEEIKCIRITKTVIRGTRYSTSRAELDEDGKQLYSMLLLNSYEPQQMHKRDLGSSSFQNVYREELIANVIYDQCAIDGLKQLNPDIVVIPADGGTPERKPVMRGWIGSAYDHYLDQYLDRDKK